VVIPTADHVLGGHRDAGLITQQVTVWLNLSGLVPLIVLLGNLVADWKFATRRLRYGLTSTWVLMVVSHVGLFVAHSWVTQILDIPQHRILHFDIFELRHGVYEGIVTVQWVAALIHAWLALTTWRIRDRSVLNVEPVPS